MTEYLSDRDPELERAWAVLEELAGSKSSANTSNHGEAWQYHGTAGAGQPFGYRPAHCFRHRDFLVAGNWPLSVALGVAFELTGGADLRVELGAGAQRWLISATLNSSHDGASWWRVYLWIEDGRPSRARELEGAQAAQSVARALVAIGEYMRTPAALEDRVRRRRRAELERIELERIVASIELEVER